jgi:RNA polymerase sigma factor (sigma-70 family)
VNYEYVETLVTAAKAGDLNAKQMLLEEFTPFIHSLSGRVFIQGYERCDIKNECFLTLCDCISKYNLNAHRFTAYATNSIKNNLNVLLINYAKHNNIDGIFSLSDDLENTFSLNHLIEEECTLIEHEYNILLSAIKNELTDSEKKLIIFVYYKNNTLTNYAYHENISYVTASKRKKKILVKLKLLLKCALQ